MSEPYERPNYHIARRIEVIEFTVKKGTGKKDDPLRYVCEYWSMDGQKLAEFDPFAPIPVVDCEDGG